MVVLQIVDIKEKVCRVKKTKESRGFRKWMD